MNASDESAAAYLEKRALLLVAIGPAIAAMFANAQTA
jgi:hypothetical protein